jgi:hypothetical protein
VRLLATFKFTAAPDLETNPVLATANGTPGFARAFTAGGSASPISPPARETPKSG